MEIRTVPAARLAIAFVAVGAVIAGAVVAVMTILGTGTQPPPLGEIKLAQTAFASGFAPYAEHASGSANLAKDQPEPRFAPVAGEPAMSVGQGPSLLDPGAVAEQERLHSAFIASVEGWLATSKTWDLPDERDGNIPSAAQLAAFNDALVAFRDVQPAYLDWLSACAARMVPSFTACRTKDPVPWAAWQSRLDALIEAEKGLATRG